MIKRSDIVIIIISLFLVTGVVIYVLNLKPHYIWSEGYSTTRDEPYDASVLNELLDGYFPGKKVEVVSDADLLEKLSPDDNKHYTYFYLGQYPFYTDSTTDLLIGFVERGNDVFIAANYMPEQLTNRLTKKPYIPDDNIDLLDLIVDTTSAENETYAPDDQALSNFETRSMTFNFTFNEFRNSKGYTYAFYDRNEAVPYQWNYFMPEFIESKGNAEILGTIKTKNLSNFIRIPCGHGYFYLYSTPITFTNFYLLKEERMEYTSKVLSYLKPGDIIYDTYSNSAPREKPNNSEQEEGPLRFILSNTALRTAWYTLLATLLLFILFRAKRMQRSIPVLEPNENRSLEFVQTIGRMYFLQRNHKQLAQQKMRLFQHFIQERYQIPAANLTDEHFQQKLHLKSEVGMQTIQDILKQFKYIENTNEVTANDIINLHQALDYFYSHCK